MGEVEGVGEGLRGCGRGGKARVVFDQRGGHDGGVPQVVREELAAFVDVWVGRDA